MMNQRPEKETIKAKTNKRVRYGLVAVICLIVLAIGITFAWFSSNISIVNGKITLGKLAIRTTVFASDGATKVFYEDEDGNQVISDRNQENDAPGIVYATGVQHRSISTRYIKIENVGTLDARLFLNIISNEITETLSDFDKGYFYIDVTDISALVNAEGGLQSYAEKYRGEASVTDGEAQQIVSTAYRLNQLVDNAKLISRDSKGVLPTGDTGYYRVDFLCYNIPDTLLTTVNSAEIQLDATITAKQSNAPFYDGDDVGTTKEVSSEEAFMQALQTAGSGDTIFLTSDINLERTSNVTIYHCVNLYLNGHTLTINGNLAYDFKDSGKCTLSVESGSTLKVKGDFIIDAPNASFTIAGGGTAGVIIGTEGHNGKFAVDCIRDEADIMAGYYQNNVSIVGYGGAVKDLQVNSNTAVRIGQNSQIGKIYSAIDARNISIVNQGTVHSIDLSSMKYWTLNKPEQIYVENGNKFTATSPAVILPSWSRGHISSVDPESGQPNYQVNTTVVQNAGAETTNWSVAVSLNGVQYSAQTRADYILANPGDAENANKVNFWNVDIKKADDMTTQVTRTGEGAYIVRMFQDTDRVSALMAEYYTVEGADYKGEKITSLTIRTYGGATVTPEDFAFMKSGTTEMPVELRTLDLRGAAMQDSLIPANAMKDSAYLQYLTLPITNVAIGQYAFAGCDIEEITLTPAITSVGTHAFQRKGAQNVYVTWDAGSQIPKEVLDGFGMSSGSTYVRLFMDENLALDINSVSTAGTTGSDKWNQYAYERYDFIDRASMTFVKTIDRINARIVYYNGTYEDNMVKASYTNGKREYVTYSVGINAFRLIAKTNRTAVALTFPDSCKEVRHAAFYHPSGFVFKSLALNNVDYIGVQAFQYAQIDYSAPRPETFQGMTYLGKEAFCGARLAPVENPSVLTSETLLGYAAANNGDPYIAGELDLSAKPGTTLTLDAAVWDMKIGAASLKLENYDLIKNGLRDTISGSGAVYGGKLSVKGCNEIGKNAFPYSFSDACKAFNQLDIQNVHSFGDHAFWNCYADLVKAGVTDEAYTSQGQVDSEFYWGAQSDSTDPPFSGCSINMLEIEGYLPVSPYPSIFSSIHRTMTFGTVYIHNLKPNATISKGLMINNKIGTLKIQSDYNVTIGSKAFDSATIGAVEVEVGGNLTCGGGCFYTCKAPAGASGTTMTLKVKGKFEAGANAFQDGKFADFARYSWSDAAGTWVHSNIIDSTDYEAFRNTLNTEGSMLYGMPFDFSQITSVGDYAFYNCDVGVGRNLVLPDSLLTCGQAAFSETDLVTAKANGLQTLHGAGANEFAYCNSLVSLEVRGLTSLPYTCFRYDTGSAPKSLQKLIISKALTSINSESFYGRSDAYWSGMVIVTDSAEARNRWYNRCYWISTTMIEGSFVEAYDAGVDLRQFQLQGVQMPQYILQSNGDGTYRVTNLRNYYWTAEDVAENKHLFKPASQMITRKPYTEDITIPSVLYSADGLTTYKITGVDYGALQRCEINGCLTFADGIRQFGYDDTKAISTDSIIDVYSGQLTGLVFEGGGTFENPKQGEDTRLVINESAFSSKTYSKLETLQLNHAQIFQKGFWKNTFTVLQTSQMKDLVVDGVSSVSNIYTAATVYEVEDAVLTGAFEEFWLNFSSPVKWTWKNVTLDAQTYYFRKFGGYYSTVEEFTLENVNFVKSIVGNSCEGCNFVGLKKLTILNCNQYTLPSIFWSANKNFENLEELAIINSKVAAINLHKPKLTKLTLKDSTVSISGDMDSLENLYIDNCTINAFSGKMDSLENLYIDNCTIMEFSGALPVLKTMTLKNSYLVDNMFKGRVMPELTSVLVEGCELTSGGSFCPLFNSINAPKCTRFTIRNTANLRWWSIDKMILAENAYITLAGNTFLWAGNTSAGENRCQMNIPAGVLDLKQQYDFKHNALYGNIGEMHFPDGSLPKQEGALKDPTNNVFDITVDDWTDSIFKNSTTTYPTNIGTLYIYAGGDLNCTPHISYANIGTLVFKNVITALPYRYKDQGKLGGIVWAADQPADENSIQYLPQKNDPYCWRADFTDMPAEQFEGLYRRMDTTTFTLFRGCTFPKEVTTLDLANTYPLSLPYQFESCKMTGVTEIIWPEESSTAASYALQSTSWPSLTEMDLTGVTLKTVSLFKEAKFEALQTLKVGSIQNGTNRSNYTFGKCQFPALTNLDFSRANIPNHQNFQECTFSVLEHLEYQNESSCESMFAYCKFPALKSLIHKPSTVHYKTFASADLPLLTTLDLRGKYFVSYAFEGVKLPSLTTILTDENTELTQGNVFAGADLTGLTNMSWDGITRLGQVVFWGVKVGNNATWTFPDLQGFIEYGNFSNITTGKLKLIFPELITCSPTNSVYKYQFSGSTAIYQIVFGEKMSVAGGGTGYGYKTEFRDMNCTVRFMYNGVVSLAAGQQLENVENLRILVDGDQLAAYKASPYWSNIADQIFAASMTSGDWTFRYIDGKEDQVQLVRYIGTETELWVPATITMDGRTLQVVDLDPGLFADKPEITVIHIPASVTRLSPSMFDGSNVASISFYGDTANAAYSADSTGRLLLSGDGKTLLRAMPGAAYPDYLLELDKTVRAIGDRAFKETAIRTVLMHGVQTISGNAFTDSSVNTLKFTMATPPMLLGDSLYLFKDNYGVGENGEAVTERGKMIYVAGLDENGAATEAYLIAYRNAPGFSGYADIISADPALTVTSTAEEPAETVLTAGGWKFRIEQGFAVLVDYTGTISDGVLTLPAVVSVTEGETTVSYTVKTVDFTAMTADLSTVTAYVVTPSETPENDELVSVGGALFAAKGATLLRYPAANTAATYTVPGTVTYIADYAFKDASKLELLKIPATAFKNMGAGVFEGTSEALVVNIVSTSSTQTASETGTESGTGTETGGERTGEGTP